MMDKREAYVMYGDTQIRPSVMHFAAHMERVLALNDHKGGWLKMSDSEIARRMDEEIDELQLEIILRRHRRVGYKDVSLVVKEAIDVANFAMMLIDPDRLQPN